MGSLNSVSLGRGLGDHPLPKVEVNLKAIRTSLKTQNKQLAKKQDISGTFSEITECRIWQFGRSDEFF